MPVKVLYMFNVAAFEMRPAFQECNTVSISCLFMALSKCLLNVKLEVAEPKHWRHVSGRL